MLYEALVGLMILIGMLLVDRRLKENRPNGIIFFPILLVYFLARFFRDHECAEVVTERSIDAIGEAVLKLIADGEYAAGLARKALKAAEMFRLERVAGQFHDLVEETMHGLKQG